MTGDYNSVNSGEGNDFINAAGNRNTIQGEAGYDHIDVKGNDSNIDAGDNDDKVNVQGDRNTVDGGAGRDQVDLNGEGQYFHCARLHREE